MSRSPKMSRRDWFRLSRPSKEKWLGEQEEVGGDANGLQPMDHPPNHDGMDLAELPPLREASLSLQEVAVLLSDIAKYGTNIQLIQRRDGPNSRAVCQSASELGHAKELYLAGSVNRLQIRYEWQDARWIDTLSKQERGDTRLVRVTHPA